MVPRPTRSGHQVLRQLVLSVISVSSVLIFFLIEVTGSRKVSVALVGISFCKSTIMVMSIGLYFMCLYGDPFF